MVMYFKRILLLSFSFFALNISVFAQQSLSEAKIDFTITYPNLKKEMEPIRKMLPKEFVVYVKKSKSRSEMNMPTGNTISISDIDKKQFVVLMDVMGRKIALHQNPHDSGDNAYPMPHNIRVKKINENKTIAGYPCQKAIVNYNIDGKTQEITCFYTKLLPAILTSAGNNGLNELDGFLMQYSVTENGIEMVLTANKVTPYKVDDGLFNVPSDYKKMTQEELMNMFQEQN